MEISRRAVVTGAAALGAATLEACRDSTPADTASSTHPASPGATSTSPALDVGEAPKGGWKAYLDPAAPPRRG